MKSMKSLLNANISNDVLSINLQKVLQLMRFRRIGKIISMMIASFLVPFNALYAIFFTWYHIDSSFVEGVHTAFAAELAVILNSFLADFFTSFVIRSLVLTLVLCLLIPLIVSGLVLLLFYVLCNVIVDMSIKSSSKSLRDGFKAVNESLNMYDKNTFNPVAGFVFPAIIGLVYEFFLFRNEFMLYEKMSDARGIIISSVLLLGIFVILCKIFCFIATIPVKNIKVNAGISKYDFDKLWLQKDPIEKKEREEAEIRKIEEERRNREKKLEKERIFNQNHAIVDIYFDKLDSNFEMQIYDNGVYLSKINARETYRTYVLIGYHRFTFQFINKVEGGYFPQKEYKVNLEVGEIHRIIVN